MDKIGKAPQVIAEKITHRLIDGEKEESFAVRLSRAGDEENHGDKNIAKGGNRLSDGTMDEKEKSPTPQKRGSRFCFLFFVYSDYVAFIIATRCLSLQATFI